MDKDVIEVLADKSSEELQEILSVLPKDQRDVVNAGVRIYKARRSPIEFAEITSGGAFKRAPHLEVLNDIMVDACYNQRFVIVSLPCRHGKSHFVSEWFPAWALGRFPDKKMMVASYGKTTAQKFSSKVRDNFMNASEEIFDGLSLRRDSKAKDQFAVEGHNGELFATGVGSPLIGTGGHLIVVDDLYKDMKQAYSKAYDNELKDWWDNAMRSRLEPGGSFVVVLARWREDDIAGYLLEKAKTDPEADPWVEIRIPAICDSEDDIMGREIGDPLWPERYDIDDLKRIRASVGPLGWDAQYQQKPRSMDSSMFPPENWQFEELSNVPKGIDLVRFWDLSAGGAQSDFLAGVLMALDSRGLIYILDVVHEKFTESNAEMRIEQKVQDTANADKEKYGHVRIKLEQTAGLGKSVATNYVSNILAGFDVEAISVGSADKRSRAAAFASQQQAENVYLINRPTPGPGPGGDAKWFKEFISELALFDTAPHDDQVDAASLAYLALVENRGKSSKGSVTSGSDVAKKIQEKSKPEPRKNRGREIIGNVDSSKKLRKFRRSSVYRPQ